MSVGVEGEIRGKNSLHPQGPGSPGLRDARGGDSAKAGKTQPQTNSPNQTKHSFVLKCWFPFSWQEFKGERSVLSTPPHVAGLVGRSRRLRTCMGTVLELGKPPGF